MPAQERVELVVELWNSLAPGKIPVPDWQQDLIGDRLARLEDVLPEERSVPWKRSASASSPTGRDPAQSHDREGRPRGRLSARGTMSWCSTPTRSPVSTSSSRAARGLE